jgi:hypothetical protein
MPHYPDYGVAQIGGRALAMEHTDRQKYFIRPMASAVKNTLRHVKGEEHITHLGLEYYD